MKVNLQSEACQKNRQEGGGWGAKRERGGENLIIEINAPFFSYMIR